VSFVLCTALKIECLVLANKNVLFKFCEHLKISSSKVKILNFETCQIDGVMACWLLCCQLWAYGVLLSKVTLSFLRKLPVNSYVNSSDFICYLSVMCSIPDICWISLIFSSTYSLSPEETWKSCSLPSTILFELIVF
jgi:hypothetical protein